MRILLVEDERPFARLLARRLEGAGYAVDLAFTGDDGLKLATEHDVDLAILDVMLPGVDGLEIARSLREKGSQLPILMLTARDAIDDRVKGLQSGADDYLVKPFAFAELLARVEALLRRTGRAGKISYGPLRLDAAARTVVVDGKNVVLTAKEFDLLECLLRARGRVLTRREIKEMVWGFSFDAETKVVDLYVHYLRRKLEKAGAHDLIDTVRSIGYSIGREATKELG